MTSYAASDAGCKLRGGSVDVSIGRPPLSQRNRIGAASAMNGCPVMTPEFTVLIPCFNEQAVVAETLDAVYAHLPDDLACEVIVIDDGSTDSTPRLLGEASAAQPKLEVLTQPYNRGYGAALKTGLLRAHGEYIAIVDADGSYPIERLPDLMRLCRGRDMVVGARVGADVTYSRLRALPKYFLRHWVSWIARMPVPDINSGMRVFRRDVAERYISILPDGFSFTITITLAMLTNHRITHFEPIPYRARVGASKISPIRDTLRFIGIIVRTGMYFAPLRALLPVAALLMLGALLSFAYDVIALDNLTDKTVLLFLFSLNTGMLALLADMIDKRTARP